MTMYDPPITSYSDTGVQLRVISDIVKMIDVRETPLLAALGGLDGGRSKFKIGANGTKFELIEDANQVLAGAGNDTNLTNNTALVTFTVADGSVFRPGHVLNIDSEYMVVKSVSTDSVTVFSRTYGGTNATHASNAAINIVGMARLEGATADFSGIEPFTQPYNYTSIFQDSVKITGTDRHVAQLGGIGDPYEYYSAKKARELMILVEKQLFHGIRAAGSAILPRSFGGLGTFITDNAVAVGGAITKTKIDDLAEACYLDGGLPDLLVVNPSVGRDVKDLIDTSSFVTALPYMNSQIGMAPIRRVVTQYGELQILMDRWCPVATAFAIDSTKAGLLTLRDFGWYPLGKTGDFDSAEVVGEFSFLVANDKAHGKLTGITS